MADAATPPQPRLRLPVVSAMASASASPRRRPYDRLEGIVAGYLRRLRTTEQPETRRVRPVR